MGDPGSGRDESEIERLDRNLSESLQERIYLATLLTTTIAAVLLIAPTAYHRITFRKQQKARLVLLANRLAIVGLGFLALAMTGVVLLITDFLFSTVVTVICTTFTGLMFATFWYALPLWRRET